MPKKKTDFWSLPKANAPFVPVFTLVLWMLCLAVGIGGIVLPYTRPRPVEKSPPPVEAQIVQVKLSDLMAPPPQSASPQPETMPPLPNTPDIPPAPAQVPTLSAPAFIKPVDAPPQQIKIDAPTVQRLDYGVGEGAQPAPLYPPEAQIDREQGTVVVRFTVDADGHVESAQAATPCRWPLLNQSAISAVRDTWRFTPGKIRVYEVAIQFELADQ